MVHSWGTGHHICPPPNIPYTTIHHYHTTLLLSVGMKHFTWNRFTSMFIFWEGGGFKVQKERNIENKINLQCWPKLRRLRNNNISLLLYYHVFIIIICISSDLGWGKCVFTKATHLYLVKNMCDPQNFTLPPTFCATWRLAED